MMARWSAFVEAEPHLAAAVRALLHQYGPGLGYLATVRPDGGPRVHPVSPVVYEGGLYCFLVASPKRGDLERDGRYALHTFPADDSEDEAYLAGRAVPVTDVKLIKRLASEMRAETRVDWRLYEFTIEVAMAVQRGVPSTAAGAWATPVRQIWHAPPVRSRTEAADSVQ
jgi:hypothetical protein